MKTLEQIRQELEVETLCSMNQSRTVNIESSVGTFALCGCTGMIAIGDRSVHLSHYDPMSLNIQVAHLANFLRDEPTAKIYVAATTNFEQIGNKYIERIDPRITNLAMLAVATITGYSSLCSMNETVLSRSIRWNGKSVLFGGAIA